jgi:hypothetical protein
LHRNARFCGSMTRVFRQNGPEIAAKGDDRMVFDGFLH